MFIRKVIFYSFQYIYHHRLLKEHRIWVGICAVYTFYMLIYLECTQSIWDLSKVYLPELLERVAAGKVLEANSNISTCNNFTVVSFIMAYNNKNVGDLFGCNVTLCVPNQHLWFSKFLYLKIFGLSNTILGVSEIRMHSVFHKEKG